MSLVDELSIKVRKKSEVRAIRIPTELGAVLEKESDVQGISVNALITLILKKYAEFDRLSEKFEYVTVSQKKFSLIIHELDDSKIERVGRDAGGTVPKEVILFWFNELSLNTFLRYVSIFSRYYKLATCEIQINGGHHTIMLRHDLGPKWSKFLRYYFEEAARQILDVVPRFEVNEDLVIMRFNANDMAKREPHV